MQLTPWNQRDDADRSGLLAVSPRKSGRKGRGRGAAVQHTRGAAEPHKLGSVDGLEAEAQRYGAALRRSATRSTPTARGVRTRPIGSPSRAGASNAEFPRSRLRRTPSRST